MLKLAESSLFWVKSVWLMVNKSEPEIFYKYS